MSKSYCEEAELDSLRKENSILKKELDRMDGELGKAKSDIRELKDTIVKLVMRYVQ